jgi:hypothetical protein
VLVLSPTVSLRPFRRHARHLQPEPVIVWLWDAAGPHRAERGITDDSTAARQAAEACIRSGHATAARVERAVTMLGIHTLTTGYQRTGQGWSAQHGDGQITKTAPYTSRMNVPSIRL